MSFLNHEAESTQPADGPNQFDPLLVVWRHKWLLMLAAVVGSGLGYLNYARQPPVYESAATLLVVPEKQSNLPIKMLESSRTTDDSLSTQMILIRSPLVIKKAAEHPELVNVPSIYASGHPGDAILAGLSVSQARASNGSLANEVLELRYRGLDPQDCAKILTIVIEAYQEFLGETRQSLSSETVNLITNAKESLLKDLTDKEQAYREFRQKSPLIWQGDSGQNIHLERLSEIESSRTALMITQSDLKAQIEAIERAIDSGTRRDVLELLASQIHSKSNASPIIPAATEAPLDSDTSLENEFQALKIEERLYQERYGTKHPKLLALRRRLQVMQELLSPEPEVSQVGAVIPEAVTETDIVTLFLDSLKQEYSIGETRRAELDDLFTKELDAARGLESYENENLARTAEIQRTQQLFDGVVRRLEEISLIKDVGGTYTQIVSEPHSGVQVLPRFSTTVASGGLLALAIAFGLGSILELSNRDYRTVGELAQHLHVNVIGQYVNCKVTADEISNQQFDATLVTCHQPSAHLSETYRDIRTSLYYSANDQGTTARVLQVTSPLPGDGKTTLAANLAIVMAQAGKRVLLIEADLRRPKLAKLFGKTSEHGLTSVLNHSRDLDDCLIACDVPNLVLLPVGRRPSNPSELLSSAEFLGLLEVVREKFDSVLIDSPPLIPVTDASVIAARVDGVLLLLSVRKELRSAAQAALKKLQAVHARLLGVVVHGQFSRESSHSPYYGGRYGYHDKYQYTADSEELPDNELALSAMTAPGK